MKAGLRNLFLPRPLESSRWVAERSPPAPPPSPVTWPPATPWVAMRSTGAFAGASTSDQSLEMVCGPHTVGCAGHSWV